MLFERRELRFDVDSREFSQVRFCDLTKSHSESDKIAIVISTRFLITSHRKARV